jgi:purine-binding chemotaxis protein CheW
MTNTYLSFKICNELFAVSVDNVLEVLEKQKITPVPNAPKFILGIINFRGEVVPVIDTWSIFNLPDRIPGSSSVIIVFDLTQKGQNLFFGALVDKVNDVIPVDNLDIKPVPAMNKEFNASFLQGIFKMNNDFIMLLDAEKLFSGDELSTIKDVHKIENQVIS